VDDRDEWILEADDIYKQVDFKSNFGGQYMRYMCISSNGPIYIERSTSRCRSGAPDFNPQHISSTVDPENRWTGVSAFWSDFLQASDSGQNGGNVYYREVSVNDLDYRSILDLLRAANNMLTEEYLETIHVITFHKMADINGKRGCDRGVSFQYIVAPLDRRTHKNPLVHFAYGEFEWAVNAITAGWNAYFTREKYGFHLTIDPRGVGDVSHLERKSYTCDGSDRGCWLVQCQLDYIMDNINNELRCENYLEVNSDPDIIWGSLDYGLFLNEECELGNTAYTSQRFNEIEFDVNNFLNYAYQWADLTDAFLTEVKCTPIPSGQTNADGSDILVNRLELVVSGSIGRWITSGLLVNIEPAQEHIRSTLSNRLKVPVKAMEMWSKFHDKSLPELINNGYITMQNLIWDTMDFGELSFTIECGWGRRYDSEIGCVDINECDPSEFPENPCNQQYLTQCINLDPGYTCGCEEGFESIPNYNDPLLDPDYPERGPFICEDKNECNDDTHSCNELQECQNTFGSYECICLPDYQSITDQNGNVICTEDIGGENLHFMDVISLVIHKLRNEFEWGLEENTGTRKKRDVADETASKLLSYGCWGPTLANYEIAFKGRVADRIDKAARTRLSCGHCFRGYFYDISPGNTCDIQSQLWYVTYFENADGSEFDPKYICGGLPDSCERATCACNLEYADFVARQISHGMFNPAVLHQTEEECYIEIVSSSPMVYQCLDNPHFYN